MSRRQALGLIVIGAAALSTVAIYNGSPFFYFDTHGYYTGGQKVVAVLSGLACEAGLGCPDRPGAGPMIGLPTVPDGAAGSGPGTISTGRSPFYGVLVYLAAQVASIWLVVAAHALATSWLLYVACRQLLPERAAVGFLGTIGVVTAFSSAPFFVGYLMPDVFAGLWILAAALSIAFRERITWPERTGLWLVLVGSMLFHRSHVVAAALLLGLIGLYVLVLARDRLRLVAPSWLAIGAAVAIGAGGFVMVDLAVTRITGSAATPPPWLLARIIEDGPGTSYLRLACATEHYAVCRFVDRMPIPVRDFLWSKEPGRGVWYVVSPEDRRRIADEQYAIVLRAVRHAPLIEIEASARNFARQIVNFGVVEFGVGDQLRTFVAESFDPAEAGLFMKSRVARGGLDLKALSVLYYVVVLGSIVLLAWRFRDLDAAAKAVVAIVAAGLLLNALVTGTVSTPDHRFQARVIWLLPALATIVALSRHGRDTARRRTAG